MDVKHTAGKNAGSEAWEDPEGNWVREAEEVRAGRGGGRGGEERRCWGREEREEREGEK